MLKHSMYRGILILALCCLLSLPVLAIRDELPPDHIAGLWAGVLTQSAGGVNSLYTFEMDLEQEGNTISGTSRIWVIDDPSIFGEISLTGVINESAIEFEETAVVQDHSLDTFSWCLKRGVLTTSLRGDIDILEGDWQGEPQPCSPGHITVYRLPEHEVDNTVEGFYTGVLTENDRHYPFELTYYEGGVRLIGYMNLDGNAKTIISNAVVSGDQLYFFELLAFELDGPYSILPCVRAGALDIRHANDGTVTEIAGEWDGIGVQCGGGSIAMIPG